MKFTVLVLTATIVFSAITPVRCSQAASQLRVAQQGDPAVQAAIQMTSRESGYSDVRKET